MAKRQMQTKIPGIGFIFGKSYSDRKGVKKYSANWMIRLADGSERATGLNDQGAAFTELVKLAGQCVTGQIVSTKGTVAELLDIAISDAKARGNRALADKKSKIDRLNKDLGKIRILDFRHHHAEQWCANATSERDGKPLAAASKNRYMAELRRAFHLGTQEEPPLCLRVPRLPHFEENNVRTGILAEEDYRKMRDAFLVDHARLFFILAYHTGMRSGEISLLRWDQVDCRAKLIRLEGKQTKNKRARAVPIYGDMGPYLELARAASCDCPWVISKDGHRVQSIRKAWATACRVAGVDLLRHDMRRTAITRMIHAGIPENEAMQMSGHRTRSVFDRYHITTEKTAAANGRKLEAFMRERESGSMTDKMTDTKQKPM